MRLLGTTILALGLVVIALPSIACGGGEVIETSADRRQALIMIHGLSSVIETEKVRSQLLKTRGVTGVVIDLPKAEALISYDGNLADELVLREAVKTAGFGSHVVDLEGL
jgi:copper chaperone CopZ